MTSLTPFAYSVLASISLSTFLAEGIENYRLAGLFVLFYAIAFFLRQFLWQEVNYDLIKIEKHNYLWFGQKGQIDNSKERRDDLVTENSNRNRNIVINLTLFIMLGVFIYSWYQTSSVQFGNAILYLMITFGILRSSLERHLLFSLLLGTIVSLLAFYQSQGENLWVLSTLPLFFFSLAVFNLSRNRTHWLKGDTFLIKTSLPASLQALTVFSAILIVASLFYPILKKIKAPIEQPSSHWTDKMAEKLVHQAERSGALEKLAEQNHDSSTNSGNSNPFQAGKSSGNSSDGMSKNSNLPTKGPNGIPKGTIGGQDRSWPSTLANNGSNSYPKNINEKPTGSSSISSSEQNRDHGDLNETSTQKGNLGNSSGNGSQATGTTKGPTTATPENENSLSDSLQKEIDFELQKEKLKVEAKAIIKGVLLLFGLGFVYWLFSFWTKVSRKPTPEDIKYEVADKKVMTDIAKRLQTLRKEHLSPEKEVIHTYNLFLEFMNSSRIPKSQHVTVSTYNDMLAKRFPYISQNITQMTSSFCNSLYGNKNISPQELKQFKTSVDQVFSAWR